MAFEMRAFINHASLVKMQLMRLGAVEKGDYAFRDDIYQSLEKPFDLNQEFMRVRVYAKKNQAYPSVELSHQVRLIKKEKGTNVFRKHFDTEEETKPFLTHFKLLFSFNRTGTEYHLKDLHIFVEEIEGIDPSIEVFGSSRKEIDDLFTELGIMTLISESIPHLIYQQNQNNLTK